MQHNRHLRTTAKDDIAQMAAATEAAVAAKAAKATKAEDDDEEASAPATKKDGIARSMLRRLSKSLSSSSSSKPKADAQQAA